MSLILDALKKLDREKSTRRDGNANIAAGILRPAPPRPGRKNRLYVIALSLSALAAAGVTYAVMEYGSPQKTETTGPGPAAAQSPAPAKQQVAAVLPAPEPARGVRPDETSPLKRFRSLSNAKSSPFLRRSSRKQPVRRQRVPQSRRVLRRPQILCRPGSKPRRPAIPVKPLPRPR